MLQEILLQLYYILMHRILRTAILLLLLIFQIAAYSQTGFKQFYSFEDLNYSSVDFDEIAFSEDELIVRGNAFVEGPNKRGILLAGLDTMGNLLWHKIILDSMSNYQSNTPSGLLIKGGKIYLPAALQSDPLLFIFDRETLEFEEYNYDMDFSYISSRDILMHNNEIYIFGIVQRFSPNVDNLVMKLDTLGNLIWSRQVGTSSYDEFFGDVIVDENAQLVVSSSLLQHHNNINYPYIYSIDSNGNYTDIWLGEKNDPKTQGDGPLRKTADGHWIQASRDILYVHLTEFYFSPSITCLDENFNLLWKKNFTDYKYWHDGFIEMEYDSIRDEYVIVGSKIVFFSDEPYDGASSSWLVKFKADGEIIWDVADTSSVGMIPKLHYAAGLEIAPSGSIYAAGYLQAERNYGWIMKVTPDGCFDTLCTTTSILDQINKQNASASVYPNPASDMITVEVGQWQPGMQVVLYDMSGQAVIKVNLSSKETSIPFDLSSGMYVYNIKAGSELIGSGKVTVVR
jgi:hypothetical protein